MAKVRTSQDARGNVMLEDPPIARFLFSDTRIAPFWLLVRLWAGWMWIDAASNKVTDPAWVNGGTAVKGFWERALAVGPSGKPVIAFDWYGDFIQALYNAEAWTWLAPIIAWGELFIGVALVLGLFTGVAAFGGGLLNWTFVMAGTASTNGLLFLVAVLLMLAWKTAGWWGLDRWALPALGTPWTPGRLVYTNTPVRTPTRA